MKRHAIPLAEHRRRERIRTLTAGVAEAAVLALCVAAASVLTVVVWSAR
jgi:hypothetical protein